MTMILALDTSTAACTAALLERDGTIIASRDELIGRGHAERLVPMIEEMLDGHVPSKILVGVGPGSFTGLRVGIAAAHGMAIGWSVPLTGMNSLALLAASAPPGEGKLAAAMTGGHGELFVQTFNRKKLTATGPILNLTPDQLQGIQLALADVVSRGTAAGAQIRGLSIAGKTGTAQNPPYPDNAWFVGYAPVDDPKIVVAILVEEGLHGSAAARVATKMMERYLKARLTIASVIE